MDTKLIEAFIVVADNLSFTRAAEQLGTTQPLLSRAIRRLEDVVGEELIDRRSRQIALTAAGLALRREAQNILNQIGVAVQRARSAGHGSPGLLRIGYVGAAHSQFFHRGIRKFRETHPEVTLDLIMMSGSSQVDALRAGELDFGILRFDDHDRQNLTWKIIGRARLILAAPADWALAPNQPIDLATLRDAPFIFAHPDIAPDVHAAHVACCDAAGFQPRIVRYVRESDELRFLVATGFGAGFVYETTLLTQMDGVRFLPIANPPENLFVDFYLTWLPQHPPRLAQSFIACMTQETYIASIVPRDEGFGLEWHHAAF